MIAGKNGRIRKMVTRTLVFHLYVYDDKHYFENLAYRMHMQCLKRYASVFHKACFNISTDNINDIETVTRIKHEIIDCGFKNLEIIVTENDQYCEVNTFKHFIIDRFGTNNDMVFFGHTKGICNVIDGVNYPENILHWIYTMYFFNLEDEYVTNMQMRLIHSYGGHKDTFYGTLRLFYDNYRVSMYSGTFYWVNVMKLYEDNRWGRITIPNICNRNFCEELPFVYRDENNSYNGVASLYNMYIENGNFYEQNDWDAISMQLSMGDNTKYLEVYDQLRNQM